MFAGVAGVDALADAERFLADLLAIGVVEQPEVMTRVHQHGISERTLRRANIALGVVSRKDPFIGG
jgi:hypothetical protein